MMSVAAIGFAELVMLLGLGGGFGLPLGVPPLPEDPLLARLAPEECLFYTSSAGTATPDPKSSNQTEQLLAEPEVQQLIAEVEKRIRAALAKQALREGPNMEALYNDAADGVKLLLTRPVAVYVASVTPPLKPGSPPAVRGGLVVSLGDDAPRVKAALEKHQQQFLREAAKPVEIAGETWHRLTLDPQAPPITWSVKGRYLLVGVGDGEAEAMLQRARGQAPAWLSRLRQQLPVDRCSTVSYVNVKAIIDQFGVLGGPQLMAVLDATGLKNVTALTTVTGLDKEGFVGKTLLAIDGEPAGVLRLASAKPLSAADLAPIPADATVALAFRLDPDAALETILSVVEKIEPKARAEFLKELAQIEEQLGLRLREDLLSALGDAWCAYVSPSESGLLPLGPTAVVQVKDSQRLAKVQEKLIAAFEREVGRGMEADNPRRPRIERFAFAGKEIYFFNAREKDFPLAPSWCLTEKELIVALFPQNIKAYLSRSGSEPSLAKVPAVAAALGEEGGPLKLFYCDTRRFFELLYPLLPLAAQAATTQMQREGIDINVSLLPSARAIGPHLRPALTTVRRTAAGIQIESRQTLPGGNVGTTLPLGAALLVPAVGAARQAGQRAQSANNLKQIALAMQIYHEAHNKFPPAYTTDKEGKPLLSWRVLILPYLEQQQLYQQFRLDEPWDSEHNKKLIAQIPPFYRSPASTAPAGQTNYLTLRGEKTVFPGKDGVSAQQIRDGMSNTIMVVEANNSRAVEWTKPDDFVPDEKNPVAGLLGLWPNGFNAAFCDGSVRFIRSTIDANTLKALFTRDGGEMVDFNKF